MRKLSQTIFLSLFFLSCFAFLPNELVAQTEPTYFEIRGTGLNRNAAGILKIGNQIIYQNYGRGLRLTILNKANLAVVSDEIFDCYGSSGRSDALAIALGGVDAGEIGILTSHDAWEAGVTQNLDNAFLRLGLTRAAATINSGARRPYAAIFEGASNGENSGKAVEASFSATSNQPFAEIRGYFHNGSFVATGTQPNALLRPQGDGAEVIVNYAGNVGIGTLNPGSYKLAVEGKIGANEIKVTTAGWADFVFHDDYVLRPLADVEQFIKEKGHLPDVPSEVEVLENGIELGAMNAVLLQKIEELTLYMIEMKKENKQLNQSVLELKEENRELRNRDALIQNLLERLESLEEASK